MKWLAAINTSFLQNVITQITVTHLYDHCYFQLCSTVSLCQQSKNELFLPLGEIKYTSSLYGVFSPYSMAKIFTWFQALQTTQWVQTTCTSIWNEIDNHVFSI